MKKLKLLKINKVELSTPELTRIKGGWCTNYDCQCMPGTQITNDVDVTLDGQSTDGYLPQLDGTC